MLFVLLCGLPNFEAKAQQNHINQMGGRVRSIMQVKLFQQRRSLHVTMLPFLLCLSVMTFATLAYGQAATGRLSGTVSGPDGLISNATVVVTEIKPNSHTRR